MAVILWCIQFMLLNQDKKRADVKISSIAINFFVKLIKQLKEAEILLKIIANFEPSNSGLFMALGAVKGEDSTKADFKSA